MKHSARLFMDQICRACCQIQSTRNGQVQVKLCKIAAICIRIVQFVTNGSILIGNAKRVLQFYHIAKGFHTLLIRFCVERPAVKSQYYLENELKTSWTMFPLSFSRCRRILHTNLYSRDSCSFQTLKVGACLPPQLASYTNLGTGSL